MIRETLLQESILHCNSSGVIHPNRNVFTMVLAEMSAMDRATHQHENLLRHVCVCENPLQNERGYVQMNLFETLTHQSVGCRKLKQCNNIKILFHFEIFMYFWFLDWQKNICLEKSIFQSFILSKISKHKPLIFFLNIYLCN